MHWAIRKYGYIVLAGWVSLVWGATFGTVIPIGGHVADIALDERRGRLYVANFTANRIEVISTADNTLQAPILLYPQPDLPIGSPGSLALSPDGRYLVVGHYAKWDPPILLPAVTVLDLEAGTRQTHIRGVRGPSPLAIAFGSGTQALIANGPPPKVEPPLAPFELLDPATGNFETLPLAPVDTKDLPVPFATFPPEILKASAGVSGDGQIIYMLVQTRDEKGEHPLIVRYRVADKDLRLVGVTSMPELGPRAVSVDRDGSSFLAGWVLLNSRSILLAQFPYPSGKLNIGSHAFDYSRNLVYAHIPISGATASPSRMAPPEEGPVLTIFDSDNLTVRERIRLRENLAGKSLLSSDLQVMYAASDSGVTVLPIGALDRTPRVMALQEDAVFRGRAFDRRVITQEIDVVDPGGGNTDFTVSTAATGVHLSPASGTTPARVRIEVDPTTYLANKGTTAVFVQIKSDAAVNLPIPVRLLINTRAPDQRGAFFNVPGKLVDILADPVRDRFYILRQDKNVALVFDGTSFNQLTTLRTGNTPVQMALTVDAKYLIVTNDNSQIANVYDLDTLQPSDFIEMPGGHYPRSVAVSNQAILISNRVAGPVHTIDRVNFEGRIAEELRRLGIYKNDINSDTVMNASLSGEYIFIAMPDGTLVLYEAAADTYCPPVPPACGFVASRKDFGELSGAYAALTDRMFAVDNNIVNWSLVPITRLETDTGLSSGLAFADGFGLRTTSPSASSPGVIQRLDLTTLQPLLSRLMVESPLLFRSLRTPTVGQIGQTILPFTRTLAPLANRASIVSLTISGFTVLPRNFDAPAPTLSVDRIVNLADQSQGVAPGGLISIFGSNFSPTSIVNASLPLPTILGDVSVAVNDVAAPLLRVSPDRIDAQLPFNVVGGATLVVLTPDGVGGPFSFTILPGAPAIFRTGTAGPDTGLPTVFRTINNELVTLTNPIHPEDQIIILATGLGVTSPAVESGAPAPAEPLAVASLTPVVTLGGVSLPVLFAGLVPGQVGVYQINAIVPPSVPEGMDVPLTIRQGAYSTTLSVRVVK